MPFVQSDSVEIEWPLIDALRGGGYLVLSVTSTPPTTMTRERVEGKERTAEDRKGGDEQVVRFHMRRAKRKEAWKIRFRAWRYGKVFVAL